MKTTVAQPQLPDSAQSETKDAENKEKSAAGGSAAERGLDYQARVAAIALTYLLLEQKVSWIDDVFNDLPVLVDAETGGPGDDIALKTNTGKSVEVQVKRGLKRGNDLWDALCALAKGIQDSRWIGPYISIHFLSLNPLLVRRRRYSRGERYPSALCGCHSL